MAGWKKSREQVADFSPGNFSRHGAPSVADTSFLNGPDSRSGAMLLTGGGSRLVCLIMDVFTGIAW